MVHRLMRQSGAHGSQDKDQGHAAVFFHAHGSQDSTHQTTNGQYSGRAGTSNGAGNHHHNHQQQQAEDTALIEASYNLMHQIVDTAGLLIKSHKEGSGYEVIHTSK